MIEDWRDMFVGRETELARLKSAWSAAKLNKPQVVSIVAESGLGKTRLVQEFFSWLSVTDDGVEGAGYWPDELARTHNRRARRELMTLNPDPKDCATDGRSIPFFWWAIQLPDCEDDPNRVVTSLCQYEYRLKIHLLAYLNAIRVSELKRAHAASGGGTAVDLGLNAAGELLPELVLSAIPGGTLAFTVLSSLIDMGKWGYDAAQREVAIKAIETTMAPAQAHENQRRDIAETILSNLRVVCHSPPKPLNRVPLVLVIDDAQWITGDLSLCKLIADLLKLAGAEGWPLLIIVTAWEAEWRSNKRISWDSTHVDSIRSLFDQADVALSEITLEPIVNFERIIKAAFPGLSLEQCDMIVDKAEGNALCLYDILNHLIERPQFFVDRNPKKALNQSDADALKSLAFDDIIWARITNAPYHVQTALGLGSTQGLRFSSDIVNSAAKALNLSQAEKGLIEGENPYAFVTRDGGDMIEFRARYYMRIALENLDNHLDRDSVQKAIRSALETSTFIASDTETNGAEAIWQSQLALFDSDDPNQCTVGYDALYNLAAKAFGQKDYLAALQYARQWAGLWLNGKAGSSTTGKMNWIETILRDLGDVPLAHDFSLDVLKHARNNLLRAQSAEPNGNLDYLERELTMSLERVATNLWLKSQYQEMHPLYVEAYHLREKHYNKTMDADSTLHFSVATAQVAGSTEQVEGFDAAFWFYEQAVHLAEKYVDFGPNKQATLNLVSAQHGFGRALTMVARHTEAETILREALKALLAFCDEPDNREWLEKCFHVGNQLTHTLLGMKRFKQAMVAADQSLKYLRQLESIWSLDWHKVAIKGVYLNILDAAREAGDYVTAADALKTGTELAEKDNETNETIGTLEYLALFAERLFDLQKATNLNEALKTIQSVLATKRKLVLQSPTFHFISDKVYILDKVAHTHLALQQFEEADTSIAEIDSTLPELRSLVKTDSDNERFVDCLYRLGDLYRLRNENDLALVQFNIGLERAYRLAVNADTLNLKRQISLFLERLALLCETKADDKAALAYLLACLVLKEEIAKVSDGLQAFDDLAIIAGKIGGHFSKLGARVQAIKYYQYAWETRRSLEKRIGVKAEADVKQAEANLNWARSLPIQMKLTVFSISPWVPPSEWLLPKPALATARNMLCLCGSGKRYKHCHGKL